MEKEERTREVEGREISFIDLTQILSEEAVARRLVQDGRSAMEDLNEKARLQLRYEESIRQEEEAREKKLKELSILPRLLVDTYDGENLSIRLTKVSHASFPEDLQLVRNFPQRKWSEREGAWLVPLTDPNLTHLFNSWKESNLEVTPAGQLLLTYYQKTHAVAELHLKERLEYLEKGASVVVPPTDYLFSTKPYPHQIVAFNSARKAEFFALLMEMGTGKTKVVIDVICDRVLRRKKEASSDKPFKQFKALIVSPKTICHNWELELEKHTTVEMNVGRLDRWNTYWRMEELLGLVRDKETPCLVGIINYEGVKMLEEALKKVQWDLMVCDESIWIKTPDTERAKACDRVGKTCASRFILTGLPITKNVMDLYGQFDFLKEGLLGFTSYYAYQSYFGEQNYWGGTSGWKRDKLPELQERLSKFSFVIRRNQCLALPEKIYQTLEVEMGEEQKIAYVQMAENLIVDLEALEDKKLSKLSMEELNAGVEQELNLARAELASGYKPDESDRFASARVMIVQLLRLAQITSGYLVLEDQSIKRFTPNPKVAAVKDILDDLDDTEKVIIWARFREDIDLLVRTFPGYGAVPFYGGLSDKNREEYIKRFKTTDHCRLFVAQPQTGGFGINLTEASRVIYFSNDFSLQNRSQSEDRCHRIGQTKNVLYTDILVPNTIDDVVLNALKEKRDLSDLLTNKDRIIASLRSQLAAVRGEKGTQ